MPRRRSASCAAALGLVLAGTGAVQAQVGTSLNRAGSGARAAGMGDAFVAVSDDGTAASWNPAGLAQLRQPELSLVYVVSDRGLRVSGLRSADDATAYSSRRSRYANSSIDFASAALPFSLARKPVTLQIGWHRLYQLSGQFSGNLDRYLTRDPGTPVGSVSLNSGTSGNIDLLSVAGAVKLTARMAVGGSLDFWRGGWTERASMAEEPGEHDASAFFARNSRQRLRGHTFTVGALLTHPAWSAGVVYHAPFWSSFSVHGDSYSTEAPPQHVEAPGARFRLPRSVAAGIALRPAPRWTAAVAVTHDQWTGALLDHIPGQPGALNFFDNLPPALSTTRDTVSFNAGLEHLLLGAGAVVPLRIGFGWEPQGDMDPVTRDPVSYLLLSGGAGYNTNRFKFDAAVQYRRASFRASDVLSVDTALAGGLARDALGRATLDEWRVKVSAIYRIQDTEGLRGILRRIFG